MNMRAKHLFRPSASRIYCLSHKYFYESRGIYFHFDHPPPKKKSVLTLKNPTPKPGQKKVEELHHSVKMQFYDYPDFDALFSFFPSPF